MFNQPILSILEFHHWNNYFARGSSAAFNYQNKVHGGDDNLIVDNGNKGVIVPDLQMYETKHTHNLMFNP